MNTKLVAALAIALALVSACRTANAPETNASLPANTTVVNGNAAVNSTPAANTTTKTVPTDLNKLAERIVTQSAGVKEGEIVFISGSVRDLELLENIATEVRKAGGQPLLELNSERMTKRSYTDVPEKYDAQEPKLALALAKIINVSINVDTGETENLLADISRARRKARAEAGEPVGVEFTKNKVRSINIGNELYPTEWRAKRFEMPLDDFARLFWEGVNVDYASLQATSEKARTALTGKELEITHPNGTNLRLNLDGKPAYISDGIISADDVEKGNLDVFLPAGEAAILPAANSGDGKFIIEKQFFEGKEIRNLTLVFAGGKLTEMTGEGEGFAALKADYDTRGAGKELLGYVDIGINPNYALAPGTKLGNWVSAGMVSVGTGGNTWAGGANTVSYGLGGHLAGATVKIDGKTIVENGVLKL
ncbi:MAG TPA: aminopeptidase [Pyrinomonadaceae bacterium]|jgi:leucyl aminopeptidase (aminopeptidase T)